MNCLCRPLRTISVRIILLDETDFLHEIKDDLSGETLLDVVFARLNLIETSYFGLRYLDDEHQTHWLDPKTRLSRQLHGSDVYDMYFGVKFYAADPTKLLEEITRYQLFLQVKHDVLQGRLPVSFELAAELGAFIVQSELGDYDSRRNSIGYVSEFRLVANQSREMENRVTELHQQLKGMSPSVAELNYLDKVKWHDMYGVDLHPVLGEDSVEYFLGLTPSGIVVLRNKTTVACYYWPRIAKVYFKGRYFMLRVYDKNNEVSTYGFETPRKSACRHLWRCCVEHHAFFRLVHVGPIQSPDGLSGSGSGANSNGGPGELFSLGSRFRYSGRTEKQAVRDAINNGRTPPNFKRTPSRRQPRRTIDELLENNKNNTKPEHKSISIPQLAQGLDSSNRSTSLIPPNSLSIRHNHGYNNNNNSGNNSGAQIDSPRSTRSASWSRTQQKGLFGVTASPQSVRSVATRKSLNNNTNTNNMPAATSNTQHRFRSSSIESQSSNDSRSCKRHRRNRRTSDNESELSRGSGRSNRSLNSHRKHRRQRSKHRRNDSGSDNDSSRARSFSGHRKSTGGSTGGGSIIGSNSLELIDSNVQWHDVQRRQADTAGGGSVQQASVMKSSQAVTSTHHHSHHPSNDTDSHSHGSGSNHHRSRRHKKNRSPSDRSRVWSSELAKHLQFDLVETAGMTEDQLREIPYTVVETHSHKRLSNNPVKVHKNNHHTKNKDRVDRIRGIYIPDHNFSEPGINGSIRSTSTVSSRDCERRSSLVRMMSSLSMGDFISPSGSCHPLDKSELRVSHEHTDSGLGADQDYAYSSERSSDSTKYGTNKSSGTSVTSGKHRTHQYSTLGSSTVINLNGNTGVDISGSSTGNGNNNQHNQHHQQYSSHHDASAVSNRKPPVHPNHIITNTTTTTISNTTATTPTTATTSSYHHHHHHHHQQSPNQNSTIVSPAVYTTSSSASNNSSSSNNRFLYNNTHFHNNQYTFSLNGGNILYGNMIGGGIADASPYGVTGTDASSIENNSDYCISNNRGYLIDSRLLAMAPLYCSSPSVVKNDFRQSRATKSDICAVTSRRSSIMSPSPSRNLSSSTSCTSSNHNQKSSSSLARQHKSTKLSSIKSDILLSYLRNSNHHSQAASPYQISNGAPSAFTAGRNCANGANGMQILSPKQQQQQPLVPETTDYDGYYPSGLQHQDGQAGDILPRLYHTTSTSTLECGNSLYQFQQQQQQQYCRNNHHQPPQQLLKQHQQNYLNNFNVTPHSNAIHHLHHLGPLLYLDSNIIANSINTKCTNISFATTTNTITTTTATSTTTNTSTTNINNSNNLNNVLNNTKNISNLSVQSNSTIVGEMSTEL